ncbi:MAG: cupin-like domain-containing protein [Steroidobacteraceae bacterium]|jgi:mannose-6-phosphate isomerase-like protein (cupin superfamily)
MQAAVDFSQAPATAGRLLGLDEDMFPAYFDRYPFKIEHALVGHRLLQLPALVDLAGSLNRPILYFKGDHAINQVDGGSATGPKRTFVERNLARPELSAQETIERIENARAWMQLRDVGSDPQYAALLMEIIEEFRGPVERVAPGISAPRMDIFVSSPGATTPFHLDEEHNFLLQIRGSKTLSIADGFDTAVLDRESLRAYFAGSGELALYSPRLEQLSAHVELRSGEGVHIPPCHPHWVQNGDEVSISVGVLWFSDVTARRRHLYRVNRWLERIGMNPAIPGDRPMRDAIKALPLMVKRRVRRWSKF